jgi:hypothetical protein
MRCVVAFARVLACTALLSAMPAAVRAEPVFVPLNGSSKRYSPIDFGYRVEATQSGGRVHVYVELDGPAAKSFRGGRLTLTKERNVAVEVTLGLARQVGDAKSHLRFDFDPKAADGGEAIIYSEVIAGRPLTANFGGFRLSVEALREKAKLSSGDSSDPPERDPEEAFRKACELVAALEGKHDLLQGVSQVKPAVQRDEQKRLKSAHLVLENNAVPPGKDAAKAKDDSKPFFYVSVAVWSGRSQQPPADVHEFEWKGQTYQMWVRVYGSDAELVKAVRKSVDKPLRGPFAPKK